VNWENKIEALLGKGSNDIVKEAQRIADELYKAGGEYSVHPFSTERLSDRPRVTSDRLKELKNVVSKGNAEAKEDFLRLWRVLPDPVLLNNYLGANPLSAEEKKYWRFAVRDLGGNGNSNQLAQDSLPPLWDYNTFVSALVGTESNGKLQPALLQFNLADVQPFITKARRTQDLWAGSYVLSFFCWHIMKSLAETYGPDCILQPVLREQPLVDLWLQETKNLNLKNLSVSEDALLIANIPNIFTAIVPFDEAESAVNKAIDEAREKWKEISKAVRCEVKEATKIASPNPLIWDDQCRTIWERQEEDFLSGNIYWAAFPLLSETEEVTSYGEASRMCALLLSDRKRARDFNQVYEEGVKCSLSGVLQAVVPKSMSSLSDTRKWWKGLSEVRKHPYKMAGRIRGGEHLSAVYLTKRLMMQAYFETSGRNGEPVFNRHQFPSTAGIANTPCLLNIVEAACAEEKEGKTIVMHAIQGYKDAINKLLSDGNFFPASSLPIWNQEIKHGSDGLQKLLQDFLDIDGELLYVEFYELGRFKREFNIPDSSDQDIKERLKIAKEKRDNLLKLVPSAKTNRYYAIIAMDGDSMGEWISGRKKVGAETKARVLTPATHQSFTTALSGFALNDAREIVEGVGQGKLIYAGGDDVLAILPVTTLLKTLNKLYKAFRGTDNADETPKGFALRNGVLELRMGNATLSAGAVIVHESLPLTYAMEQARIAERRAKDTLGRDAFAITLLKRSGAPVEAGMKWTKCGIDVPDALEKAIALMTREPSSVSGNLSGKVSYDLLTDPLIGEGTVWQKKEEELAKAQDWEFRRRAERHLTHSKSAESKDFLNTFGQLVQHEKDNKIDSWMSVAYLLRIARELAIDISGEDNIGGEESVTGGKEGVGSEGVA
jgi:CRISPR-associated protein Cas10/Cmr2 subtype III-B